MWLHREHRLSIAVRWTLAFAWSFAVFDLLAFPFLWFQGSTEAFYLSLGVLWLCYSGLGGFLWYRSLLSSDTPQATPAEEVSLTPKQPIVSWTIRGWTLLFLGAGLGLISWLGWAWTPSDEWTATWVIWLSPFVVLGILLCSYALHRWSKPLLRFTEEDHGPAPLLWVGAAWLAILFQAGAATLFNRADWDDCYYLAAVLDYAEGEVLNDQEPTYREGIPVPVVHRTLCWELWGAVLCRLTDWNPMVIFHSMLPALVVLLTYGASYGLLRECLPRRWVPIALLGLSAYYLWGVSSHGSASNFLLPRPGQGKTVLLTVGIPLMVLLIQRGAVTPNWRWWLSLGACVIFALGVSLTAVFLGVILAACLTAVYLCKGAGNRWQLLLGMALAFSPLVLIAVAVRLALAGNYLVQPPPLTMGEWVGWIAWYTKYGCVDKLWLASLPLLAILVPPGEGRRYLIYFPILLGLTFANPVTYPPVATYLTSDTTYFRVFWLFPVGIALSVLVALVVRAAVWAGMKFQSPGLVLLVSVGILALTRTLPTLDVMGEQNHFGLPGGPQMAETLEKMPASLAPIAERLKQDSEISQVRILCNETVANFLTSYSRDFRFVQTRPLYSILFSEHGRAAEGVDRLVLGSHMWLGLPLAERIDYCLYELTYFLSPKQAKERFPVASDLRQYEFATLVKRYRVKYVITAPDSRTPDELTTAGFKLVQEDGGYSLWQREVEPEQVENLQLKR